VRGWEAGGARPKLSILRASVGQIHRYEARQQEHGEELADHALERGQATGDGSERRDVAITDARESSSR